MTYKITIERTDNGWIATDADGHVTVHEDKPYSGRLADYVNCPDEIDSLADALWFAFPNHFGKRGLQFRYPWRADR